MWEGGTCGAPLHASPKTISKFMYEGNILYPLLCTKVTF